jgi:hypothetical protein
MRRFVWEPAARLDFRRPRVGKGRIFLEFEPESIRIHGIHDRGQAY